ncbi:PHP-associated domain-containing protein, partial [Nonomuraea sp. NPDC049419]|uniref:PHP-associated domain-containing protein n=1 Tax=Nonomuraea sp. NPDC049419 TaxID=3155772 RepID=UPI0034244B95
GAAGGAVGAGQGGLRGGGQGPARAGADRFDRFGGPVWFAWFGRLAKLAGGAEPVTSGARALEPALPPCTERAVPGGWVRVDCHVHTVASGDAVTTLGRLAERVAAHRIDVVFLTDHNHLAGTADDLSRAVGCRVVPGEEVRTGSGEVLGLFLTERVPYVLPTREAIRRIRAQGGLVCAPHPYDPERSGLGGHLDELCRDGLIDAVEVFNAKIEDQRHNRAALRAARAYGLPGTVGSDAHDPDGIGAAYLEMPDFDGPRAFLEALHHARRYGEHRPHARRYAR